MIIFIYLFLFYLFNYFYYLTGAGTKRPITKRLKKSPNNKTATNNTPNATKRNFDWKPYLHSTCHILISSCPTRLLFYTPLVLISSCSNLLLSYTPLVQHASWSNLLSYTPLVLNSTCPSLVLQPTLHLSCTTLVLHSTCPTLHSSHSTLCYHMRTVLGRTW